MLRYSLNRPYRSSQRYSRERNVERHKKLALKQRILRRSSGTEHRVTRFTNTELTTDEAVGSDEETRQDGECDNDGERNGPDTRRYPVRNRRHTDVYQGQLTVVISCSENVIVVLIVVKILKTNKITALQNLVKNSSWNDATEFEWFWGSMSVVGQRNSITGLFHI